MYSYFFEFLFLSGVSHHGGLPHLLCICNLRIFVRTLMKS
nr:MAG TPA: hypothetical protein [Bacteriophage sp.]